MYRWQRSTAKSVQYSSEVIGELPVDIRREVLLVTMAHIVRSVRFLRERAEDMEFRDAIGDMLWKLDTIPFDVSEFLTIEDNPVDMLYFLISGSVEMYYVRQSTELSVVEQHFDLRAPLPVTVASQCARARCVA